jgi:lysophospholipase L1-like esterase
VRSTRLTVIGDSFVEGRGDPDPAGGYRGWVGHLAALIGIPPASCVNLGRHGATTQQTVDEQLGIALERRAPLAGFVVGLNDLLVDWNPERYRRNILVITESLTASAAVVFTTTYPDIISRLPVHETFRPLLRQRFDEANEFLRDVTSRTGVLCLDITTDPRSGEDGMWTEDGLHPSPSGHRYFGEAVATMVGFAGGMTAVPTPTNAEQGLGLISY